MTPAAAILAQWLEHRLPAPQWQWLVERRSTLERANSTRERDIAFGLIPRRLGRAELALDAHQLAAAHEAVPGWDPSQWTVETAARTLLLIDIAARDPDGFGEHYRDLCRGADLTESLTLMHALPLLPADALVDAQVGEGLRTNMRAVFEAIAHRNPYPRLHFDTHRWNHMVLKALFIDSTLAPIQGLDERANEELAGILCDYAHERWAAGRPVTPELWRCVGPFASKTLFDDLVRVLNSDVPTERDAALLAISVSPDPRKESVLVQHTKVAERIATGELSWASLAESAASDGKP